MVIIGIVVASALMALHTDYRSENSQDPSTAVHGIWHGIDIGGMDTSVSPVDDLYQFANGKWIATHSVPPDRATWGAGALVQEKVLADLHRLVSEATQRPKKRDRAETLVGDFYASGMAEDVIEKQGMRSLQAELSAIDNVHDWQSLLLIIARLNRLGVPAPLYSAAMPNFGDSKQTIFTLFSGGLGLPERDYYLSSTDDMRRLRSEYLLHMAKMLSLLGVDDSNNKARTVIDIETRLAKATPSNVALRDPHESFHNMSVAQLNDMTAGVTWNNFLFAVGVRNVETLNAAHLSFLKEVATMLLTVPIEDWKTYLRWQFIHTYAFALPSGFVKEDFRFFGAVLNGKAEIEPRWKRVVGVIDSNIGEALGKIYVARYFPPDAKTRVQTMVANLINAFRERILQNSWMSERTRERALHKLETVRVKIGYPDQWRDYHKLKIDRTSYLRNVLRCAEFEYQRNLDKIGKPRDRNEWGMTPPTVDAYSDSTLNEIVFPAGRLQPPYFDPNADDAVNYGAVGMVIGHELTHGFDDEGRQFDFEGNLKDWWEPEDAAKYRSRAGEVDRRYSQYEALPGLKVNGALTLGENIADSGGLRLAWEAFKKSLAGKPRPSDNDGYSPEQRFYLAFAQSWRRIVRPEALRVQVASDEHSPTRFRVMGTVTLMPEFYQAFGKPVPAWVVEAQKLVIW